MGANKNLVGLKKRGERLCGTKNDELDETGILEGGPCQNSTDGKET